MIKYFKFNNLNSILINKYSIKDKNNIYKFLMKKITDKRIKEGKININIQTKERQLYIFRFHN